MWLHICSCLVVCAAVACTVRAADVEAESPLSFPPTMPTDMFGGDSIELAAGGQAGALPP